MAIALAAAGAALPEAALGWARPLLLDFGPNDADYVRGFRQDWERDGRTRFHWTSQAANVLLPLRVSGDGPILRLRFRRHFVEPTNVKLTVEGRTAAAFEVRSDPAVAYRVLEVALPRLEGRHPFVLSIEAASEIERPLGLALDWMEIEPRPGTRVSLLPMLLLRWALVVAAAFVVSRLAGAPVSVAASFAGALVLASTAGVVFDALAVERIVREGSVGFVAAGVAAFAATRVPGLARRLGVEPAGRVAGALVVGVLAAFALRACLLLHPRFFYPDVRVHAAAALILARRGITDFLSGFQDSQFRLSLGLQQVGDHWYAFPYPPGLYVLAGPLIAAFGLRPEVAVSLTAATANSIEVLLVFAIARGLGLAPGAALASGWFVPLLPLFLVRLSLGYFPALVGHAVDALVLAVLLARYGRLPRRRAVGVLGGLLGLSFLAYTQGLLNFAVLFPLLWALDLVRDRPGALRRGAGLAAASILGGLIAFGVFYWRYVPALEAMRAGRPVAGERILLERFDREDRARAAAGEDALVEEPDPYSGPSLDAFRGLRKAGWRLFVFYGIFAPVVAFAVVLLARSLAADARRFVWAWALTYIALNLLSGSLPGPNLVRYNKDLEIVAPLVCIALGFALWSGWRSGRTARILTTATALGWLVFAAGRAAGALTERFVLER